MKSLATEAESLGARVRRELVTDPGLLLRGGVVVYAFRQAYDYSALWQNVVGAERPKGMVGHAAVSGDVVYGAVLVPTDDEENQRLLLAEQLAAAAVAGRMVPDWFARGAGRTVAAKVVPKAPLVQEWKRDCPAAVVAVGSTADFFAGHADPLAAATAAGGFVGALATGAKLKQCLTLLDEGVPFDDAFAKIFRSPPAQAFEAWAVKEARKAPPKAR